MIALRMVVAAAGRRRRRSNERTGGGAEVDVKEEDERRLLPAAMLADAEDIVVAVAGDGDESLDGALTAAASGDGAWARRAMHRERRE